MSAVEEYRAAMAGLDEAAAALAKAEAVRVREIGVALPDLQADVAGAEQQLRGVRQQVAAHRAQVVELVWTDGVTVLAEQPDPDAHADSLDVMALAVPGRVDDLRRATRRVGWPRWAVPRLPRLLPDPPYTPREAS